MKVNWSTYKTEVENRSLKVQYIETDNCYCIAAADAWFRLECDLDKSPSDTTDLDDFESNYKSGANATMTDHSNRTFVRQTVTESGWAYLALFINIEASTLNGVRCKNYLGADYTTTIKFFDAENGGTELVAGTQAELDTDCKRTEVTLDLAVDFDLVQGQITANSKATSDMFLDVTNGLVALGDAYTKSFVEGLNLHHTSSLETNGRAGKRMLKANALAPGVPSNVCKFSLRSPVVGQQHAMQAGLEFYRSIV